MEAVKLFIFYVEELRRWNIDITIRTIFLESATCPVLPMIQFAYKDRWYNAVRIGHDDSTDCDLWTMGRFGPNEKYTQTIALSYAKKLDLDGAWHGDPKSKHEFSKAVSALGEGG